MSINLHILKASGRLNVFEADIRSGFEEVIGKVTERIKLSNVDIVVADNSDAAIPETGVGGFAPAAHLLYVSVDPDFPDLNKKIKDEIKSTLAHELHHCVRWQTVGYGKTLLEAVVSEGLADHFDLEINGGEPRPWSIAVQGKEFEKIKEKAKIDFNNEKYDSTAWFFGSEKENIPRWSAYSLGFQLVKKHIEKTRETAAELVNKKAELFL